MSGSFASLVETCSGLEDIHMYLNLELVNVSSVEQDKHKLRHVFIGRSMCRF